VFDGAVRTAVHRLKYHGEFARAEWAAAELGEILKTFGDAVDAIVPVPLHPRRQRTRGYNQSEKLARELSALSGLPVLTALERVRDTRSQVDLDRLARTANVTGAFAATIDLQDRSIVLVDDVVTTGATLSECANACARAGASCVRGLTIATGL
jgi:ComF family protein